jgi:anti-sigma factor RsiW
MDCRETQDEILSLFDESPSPELQRRIEEHVAQCPGCASFVEQQRSLDAGMGALLQPPELSPAFRQELRRRIRRERLRDWTETLPDLVHLCSCAAATVLCAILLPFAAGPVLGVGAAATAATYLVLTAVRMWMEDAAA